MIGQLPLSLSLESVILLVWVGGTWSLWQEGIEKKQDVLEVSLVPRCDCVHSHCNWLDELCWGVDWILRCTAGDKGWKGIYDALENSCLMIETVIVKMEEMESVGGGGAGQ